MSLLEVSEIQGSFGLWVMGNGVLQVFFKSSTSFLQVLVHHSLYKGSLYFTELVFVMFVSNHKPKLRLRWTPA